MKWIMIYLTLFLPREVFDPHLVVDIDIFCKSMTDFGLVIYIHENFYDEYVKGIIYWVRSEIIPCIITPTRIFIRAPPSLVIAMENPFPNN